MASSKEENAIERFDAFMNDDAQVKSKITPYEALGISNPVAATDNDIKKAYRALARELHPDRNKRVDAEKQFNLIKKAYDCLVPEYRQCTDFLIKEEKEKQALSTSEVPISSTATGPSRSSASMRAAKPISFEERLNWVEEFSRGITSVPFSAILKRSLSAHSEPYPSDPLLAEFSKRSNRVRKYLLEDQGLKHPEEMVVKFYESVGDYCMQNTYHHKGSAEDFMKKMLNSLSLMHLNVHSLQGQQEQFATVFLIAMVAELYGGTSSKRTQSSVDRHNVGNALNEIRRWWGLSPAFGWEPPAGLSFFSRAHPSSQGKPSPSPTPKKN